MHHENNFVSDDEIEDESLFLIDTALENSQSFAESVKSNVTVKGLLTRDEHLSFRATALKNAVDFEEMCHKSDIDGLTIEWLNIATGLKSDFRHIELMPLGFRSLRRFYPVIKKHIDISSYNQNSLRILKESVGSQIIYDGKFETWLGFIPEPLEWRSIYDYGLQSRSACQFIERLRTRFQDCLRDMFVKGIALETLSKNNINDARKLFVLPGHQRHILESFQLAFDDTELIELPGFKKMLFTFRFGEKIKTDIELPVLNESSVRDICIHAGHTISSDYLDLFWSREGIKKISGSNCTISSAFSFIDCANLQSSLTTTQLDISSELRSICAFPHSIRFVQLYNDLPHRYPKTRVHPVSASVVLMEGLLTDVAQRNIYCDASSYLSEIQNNFFQIDRGICRLEFVVSIGKRSNRVTGAEFIQLECLQKLLEKHAMLVPFLRQFTFKHLREVGLYLHKRLDLAFRQGRGTGNSRLTWKVYQTELAIEKLLWGRPLCSISNQHAKNLGPGIQYPTRSLTDQKGFLCLEDSNSCCVDDRTLPPVKIFSKNEIIQRKILKISGLYNLINGSQLALGRRVLEILLKDCYESGKVYHSFEHFCLQMKVQTGNVNKHIVGGISVQDVAKQLSTAKKCKWNFVFGAVKQLLVKMNVNVEEVIQCGIDDLSLGYFPAFRIYDDNRSMGLNWEYKYGFWVLTDVPDKDSEVEREGAAMQNLVVTELEKRKLCHSSKYSGILFPWIKNVLAKIREKNLSVDGKVRVLAFVSCVAFLQEGQYVNYYSLKNLVQDLPVTQSTLRTLEIQSPFKLPFINNSTIFRLHRSIPLKFQVTKEKHVDKKHNEEPSQVLVTAWDNNRIDQIDPEENEDHSSKILDTSSTHVHALPSHKCYTRWSPAELSVLSNVTENVTLSLEQKYKRYQQECCDINVPHRSFISFKLKLNSFNKRT